MTETSFRLALVRKRRRLSQHALAQIAGVPLRTVRSLEDGTAQAVRFNTLGRLCRVLRCQPGDLFEVSLEDHAFPVLGGTDEDDIIRERLQDPSAGLDGPRVIAEVAAGTNELQTTA